MSVFLARPTECPAAKRVRSLSSSLARPASRPLPTTLPDLRAPTTTPVLYLPPLLSLLPDQLDPSSTTAPFSFAEPAAVGYTHSRLPSIDDASRWLHAALHKFRPISPDYAVLPYADAFNWDELSLPADVEGDWYIVAFRSVRRANVTESASHALYEADRAAHEEAVTQGGLLAYWYGAPSLESGRNMATCVWQSRAHAMVAMGGQKHVEAMGLAGRMYASYTLERYILTKKAGETGVAVGAWSA